MNTALLYLWSALLRRRLWHWRRSLRRPGTLVGFGAVVAALGFLFYFRRHEAIGAILQPKNLLGGAMAMIFASLIKGFWQRGLVFEPPDIEFLFTSPFTRPQIIVYRLLGNYTFAVVQSGLFYVLFGSHFQHPVFAAVCLLLLQAWCFHLATAAAIWGGSVSEESHHRLRWMMIGICFLFTALYLRLAWDLRLAPQWLLSPLAQPLFYPAVSVPDVLYAPALGQWLQHWAAAGSVAFADYARGALYLAGLALGAVASLGWLLRLKGDLFEPALASTERVAEKRLRLRQGRAVIALIRPGLASFALPRAGLFRRAGALVWKNLVVARRSKRRLWMVGAFALLYTGFIIALLHIFYDAVRQRGGPPPWNEVVSFHLGIALFLAALTFFLQRMAPFDLRLDGQHLLAFRTLPLTPLELVLAELAAPTLFCLALQAPALLALFWYARFPWPILLLVLAAFPAVALALNAVWNLHYLLVAAKRSGGQSASPSTAGAVLVVVLSFLVFYPAARVGLLLGQQALSFRASLELALAAGLLVQYLVDAVMILLLAQIFQRFEIDRGA